MPLQTNFEIQKYYQNGSRFNDVYSGDNLPQIEDGAQVINLNEFFDIGTHWIGQYVLNNDVTYFDTFGIQAYDSIMCGYFCIAFIDFMLAGKTLTDFTNIFSLKKER